MRLTIVLLAASLASAQEFDPRQFIRDLSARAEAATELEFEGEMILAGQRGESEPKLLSQAKVRFASSKPGKYLLNIAAADKDEYLLVSNGQKSWAYVPKLKQYTESEEAPVEGMDDSEAASDSERDLAETFVRLVLPTLAELDKRARAVDVNGTEDIKIGKAKEKWPVVRAGWRDSNGEATTVKLAVDPRTSRVGRMVLMQLFGRDGEKTLIQMSVDFTRFSIGSKIDDAAFEFQPPKKAKLVDAVPIPGQTGSFLVNQPAPDVELKTLEGERVRLSDLRGQTVVLSFWASWCGPCRRELPVLSKLSQELKGSGIVFYGVNDEGKGTARSFAEKAELAFPTLDDSSLKAHRLFRVQSIPSTFVIDKNGKVVRYLRGARDENVLRQAFGAAGS